MKKTNITKEIIRKRICASINVIIGTVAFLYGLIDVYLTKATVTETFMLCAVIAMYAWFMTAKQDDEVNKLRQTLKLKTETFPVELDKEGREI